MPRYYVNSHLLHPGHTVLIKHKADPLHYLALKIKDRYISDVDLDVIDAEVEEERLLCEWWQSEDRYYGRLGAYDVELILENYDILREMTQEEWLTLVISNGEVWPTGDE